VSRATGSSVAIASSMSPIVVASAWRGGPMANADMDNRSQPNLAVTLVAFESGNEGVEHGDRRVWGR
jgi:hypothetical protein